MKEETKETILLNCKSYEFFSDQLFVLEKSYFHLLDDLMGGVDNMIFALKHPEKYYNDKVFLRKVDKLSVCGQKYLTISFKFEKEMQTMIDLAPELRDLELGFNGKKISFLFISDYMDELDQAILLQSKMRSCIEKQLKLFSIFNKKNKQ